MSTYGTPHPFAEKIPGRDFWHTNIGTKQDDGSHILIIGSPKGEKCSICEEVGKFFKTKSEVKVDLGISNEAAARTNKILTRLGREKNKT